MKKILIVLFCLAYITGLVQSSDTRYNQDLNTPQDVSGGSEVAPQTGGLYLSFTDIALPGLNNLDFRVERTYSSVLSNLYNMAVNQDMSSVATVHTAEDWKYGLGSGWTFDWPFIYTDIDDQSANPVRTLFWGGNVYQLESTLSDDKDANNIKYYEVNDIKIYEDDSVRYTSDYVDKQAGQLHNLNVPSYYCLHVKNGTRYYFSEAGHLMLIRYPADAGDIRTPEMWFYYRNHDVLSGADDYADPAFRRAAKIELIEDSVGRHIDFVYEDNAENWLNEITYTVNIKGENEPRSVSYSHANASTYAVQRIDGTTHTVTDLGPVIDANDLRFTLTGFTNQLAIPDTYDYTVYEAEFSAVVEQGRGINYFACLSGIYNAHTTDGGEKYRSAAVYEYNQPLNSYTTYARDFMNGYMYDMKVTRKYALTKNGRMMYDTRYEYYGNSYGKKRNEYWSVTRVGDMSKKYVYAYDFGDKTHNMLTSVITDGNDGGFEEQIDYVYDIRKTLNYKSLYRSGILKYTEEFIYDEHNDLIYHKAPNGLETTTEYDQTFHVATHISQSGIKNGDGSTFDIVRRFIIRETDGKLLQELLYLNTGGRIEEVAVKTVSYDGYGNPVLVTDGRGNDVRTFYDETLHIFPQKVEKSVTLYDGATAGTTAVMRALMLYNSDGTVWIEADNGGYAVEHWYDALGAEIETILPDDDDVTDDIDAVSDFASAVWRTSRDYNTSITHDIDYYNESVISYGEAFDNKRVKTGVFKDGLGNVLEEVMYESMSATAPVYSSKKMTYDERGNMIAVTDADAGDTINYRTVMGTQVAVSDRTWLVRYDDLNRKVRVEYPDEGDRVVKKEIEYNDRDYLVRTINTKKAVSEAVYDIDGNVIRMSRSAGQPGEWQTYVYEYNQLKQKIAMTDPRGERVTYNYDERGLPIVQDYGDGRDVMTYDENGNLSEKIDRKKQKIVYHYDELNRNYLQEYYDHEAADMSYAMKALTYDKRGNITGVTGGELIESMGYDARNRINYITREYTDGALRTALRDNLDWVDSDLPGDQVFTFTFEYTPNDLVRQVTLPNGKVVSYGYDADKLRLTTIDTIIGAPAAPLQIIEALEYNRAGQVTAIDFGNNIRQEWNYDRRKRIKNICVTEMNTYDTLLTLNYRVDTENNITAVNENTFTYDALNRIQTSNIMCLDAAADYRRKVWAAFGTSEAVPVQGTRVYDVSADLNDDQKIDMHDHIKACQIWTDGYDKEHFTYDANGNRTGLIQNSEIFEYTYGTRNRLLTITKDGKPVCEYVYDANGNTVRKTDYAPDNTFTVYDLSYDINNRLINVKKDGAMHAHYIYDNGGMRLFKEEVGRRTYYFRNGGTVLFEVEIEAGGTTVTEHNYITSGDLIAGRITRENGGEENLAVYHLDHLNSTKLITDNLAKKVVEYEYRAFGSHLNKQDAAGNETEDTARYSYIGREFDDEIGLFYLNARFYDAATGRFINVDPIQDGNNWYVYADNNPLQFSDPTGLRVRLAARKLGFTGILSPLGPAGVHTYLVITPDKQPKNQSGYQQGPVSWIVSAYNNQEQKILEKRMNDSSDVSFDKKDLKLYVDVPTPKGMTDAEFINKIMDAYKRYDNDRTYKAFPNVDKNQGNCNNFTTGLLESGGVDSTFIDSLLGNSETNPSGFNPGLGDPLPEMRSDQDAAMKKLRESFLQPSSSNTNIHAPANVLNKKK